MKTKSSFEILSKQLPLAFTVLARRVLRVLQRLAFSRTTTHVKCNARKKMAYVVQYQRDCPPERERQREETED